jgi:cytochrome c oxidase subunit 2
MMRRGVPAFCLLLSGCSGWQSALDPHSGEALHLANLFWFFAGVCSLVWLLVAAAVALVLRRNARRATSSRPAAPGQERGKTITVTILVGLTAAILTVFTLTSFYTTRGFAWHDEHTLTLKVTGRQWWWDIVYQNQDPHQVFQTANEIHIPAGRPVTLELEAGDVIHSFWVPNLMGKQDLIPGRKNYLTIRADHPGLYRGQCAEFCGMEHAHMAILVFAHSPEEFERWRQGQLALAQMPGAPDRVAGMEIFLSRPCASCHAIAGTTAGGRLGPDLTHFGSRATIAAGRLRNTPRELELWLRDPQEHKPGVVMPKVDLSDRERQQLVAYLEGLK